MAQRMALGWLFTMDYALEEYRTGIATSCRGLSRAKLVPIQFLPLIQSDEMPRSS